MASPVFFVFRPSDFVTRVGPIDPERYFDTSGEAIMKTSQLVDDLATHHRDLAARLGEWDEQTMAAAESADQARKLKELLIVIRGGNIWLECERNGTEVHGTRKNPRVAKGKQLDPVSDFQRLEVKRLFPHFDDVEIERLFPVQIESRLNAPMILRAMLIYQRETGSLPMASSKGAAEGIGLSWVAIDNTGRGARGLSDGQTLAAIKARYFDHDGKLNPVGQEQLHRLTS